MRKISALILMGMGALLISGGAVLGETQYEIRAMQYALKRLGYYEGAVDGLSGSGTRNAMNGFATDSGVKADYWSVAYAILPKINWEVDWDARIQDAVDEHLEGILLDYPSARVSDKRVFRWGRNLSACVNMNAKNSVGAYTGYQWIMVNLYDTSTFLIDPDAMMLALPEIWTTVDQNADVLCMLGYVK